MGSICCVQRWGDTKSLAEIYYYAVQYEEDILQHISTFDGDEKEEYHLKHSKDQLSFLQEILILKTVSSHHQFAHLKAFKINLFQKCIYLPKLKEINEYDIQKLIQDVVPQIAVLHSLGIIWMDPKLENIMQFHDKYVIIDFDISMIVNLEEINQAQFLGSPGYTFSVNSITPYEDWRKFMLIIANFECSFRQLEATKYFDETYLEIKENKIENQTTFIEIFQKYHGLLKGINSEI